MHAVLHVLLRMDGQYIHEISLFIIPMQKQFCLLLTCHWRAIIVKQQFALQVVLQLHSQEKLIPEQLLLMKRSVLAAGIVSGIVLMMHQNLMRKKTLSPSVICASQD